MHNSKIKTNEHFRTLLSEVDKPIKDYADLKQLYPKVGNLCISEEEAQLQFATTRLFWAAEAGYGEELAHFVYTLDEEDIVTLDRYLQIHAGIMQLTDQLAWKHIPIEYLYRYFVETKKGLGEYDNVLLALVSYGCGMLEDKSETLTPEQQRRLYAYTGYKVIPKYIISPYAKLKKELLAQVRDGENTSKEPDFLKYRDFISAQDSAVVRRYLFLSEELAVLALSELSAEKLPMYFRAFTRKYPYGLPSAAHVEYAIGDFDYLLSSLQLAKPFIHDDDSIPPLEQGMIQVFFGASFSDVQSWLGGDDKMAKALKDLITCKQDAEKNRAAVKLHSILKAAETPICMQYVCKLYTNKKAYLEFLQCFTRVAVMDSESEYLRDLKQAVKMPKELTPDAVRHHYLDFLYDRNDKAYPKILGMERHDALNLLTPDIPANVLGMNLLMGVSKSIYKGYSNVLKGRMSKLITSLRRLPPKEVVSKAGEGFSKLLSE